MSNRKPGSISSDPAHPISLAISLSGGGHRAALFAIGVLLYLADAGKNREVVSISSVSGGSLTNGFIAQAGKYHTKDADSVRRDLGALARQISSRGTFWASFFTRLYALALVGTFLATFLVWFLEWGALFRFLAWVGLVAMWAVAIAGPRGYVAGRAFAKTLFSPKGRPTRLGEIEKEIDHVICATHLNAGEHTYFSGNFVYSYRFGWGSPGDFPLHAAVQASAAYPGGFPVRWVRSSQFCFQRKEEVPALMALTDGGVYDNMADQWPSGVARQKRKSGLGARIRVANTLIIVNASSGLPLSSVDRLALPLVGELLALLRVVGVMYDNSASLRLRELIDRFNLAERQGEGLRGTLVYIEQSPFRVPDYFKKYAHYWPARGARAEAALVHLANQNRKEWDNIVSRNKDVPTTLRRIDLSTATDLIRQAYILAMINSHVILGFPLLPVPERGAIQALLKD